MCAGDAPVEAAAGPFLEVAGGTGAACALDGNGRPTCWGLAGAPNEALTDLGVGDGFACGRTAQEDVVCWGDAPRARIDGPVHALAVGERHLCAAFADGVTCYGLQGAGAELDAPRGRPLDDLAVGPDSGCGRAEDGATVCWGALRPVSSTS